MFEVLFLLAIVCTLCTEYRRHKQVKRFEQRLADIEDAHDSMFDALFEVVEDDVPESDGK
jgi:hypothetical protein